MNYYFEVLKKYSVFYGRATRAEYWYFSLFSSLIGVAISIVAAIVSPKINLLSDAYSLLVVIPGLAVSARRLHDIGKSGWMQLVIFIPVVGLIWLIILMATDSNPGENKYGPNPKGVPTKQ
jgi:uncharacterized membrane protein YhaH (DUF805 family)